MGAVETLILWENLAVERITLVNNQTQGIFVPVRCVVKAIFSDVILQRRAS